MPCFQRSILHSFTVAENKFAVLGNKIVIDKLATLPHIQRKPIQYLKITEYGSEKITEGRFDE